jgi:hypothetical protein
MQDKRKAFEEKLDAQFEKWNAQIALLKASDLSLDAFYGCKKQIME